MDTEPETLKLWHRMASSLQSCIKYRHSLKQTVSDINVTEIFIKHNGQTDEDAIVFWTQLMAVTGLKEHMEAIFQSSFKKGWSKDQRKMVQQIALSKYSQVTSEFIEYVSQSIRRNESLWSLRRISFPNLHKIIRVFIKLTTYAIEILVALLLVNTKLGMIPFGWPCTST